MIVHFALAHWPGALGPAAMPLSLWALERHWFCFALSPLVWKACVVLQLLALVRFWGLGFLALEAIGSIGVRLATRFLALAS